MHKLVLTGKRTEWRQFLDKEETSLVVTFNKETLAIADAESTHFYHLMKLFGDALNVIIYFFKK